MTRTPRLRIGHEQRRDRLTYPSSPVKDLRRCPARTLHYDLTSATTVSSHAGTSGCTSTRVVAAQCRQVYDADLSQLQSYSSASRTVMKIPRNEQPRRRTRGRE